MIRSMLYVAYPGRRASGRAAAILALLLVLAGPARALETSAKQALLVDMNTGTTLFEKKADEPMAPASMSKTMTVLMVFEQLRSGRLSLDDTLPVSEKAWRMGGSKMFVKVDTRVRVEDLLQGIIVQSGNDASIVIAEGLAGSEQAFAEEMSRRAKQLGLTGSRFANATGWPDPNQIMTPRDLARVAELTIRQFPEYYPYYSERSFTYNGIRQANRNPLLSKDIGVDGLKTGHTQDSGFGLTASAVRKDRRLILVVNGLESARARGRESERLLEWGFRNFDNYKLFSAGDTVAAAEVWLGAAPTVPLEIAGDMVITLPVRARPDMVVKAVYDGPIPAPIAKGTPIAKLVVTAPGTEPREVLLLAGADVGRLGPVGRLVAAFKYLLWGGPD